jgi:streptomycin 6-kinase
MILDRLLEAWSCRVSGPELRGAVAVVYPVRREDGTDAMLKISLPHPGNRAEPYALVAWNGVGAVRLLERDDDSFAMLLERLHPESLATLGNPIKAVTIAGRLARRLAVPASPDVPRLADLVATWATEIPDENPLPQRVVEAAVATSKEFADDQPDTLVHGDLHFANVLRAEREPWLAIDPKGWAGDPAYDGLTLLRNRWDPADLRRRIDAFAEAAEVDRERVTRWAQARAVVEGQWGRRNGDPEFVSAICDHIAIALCL